jgi:hypothetical protein
MANDLDIPFDRITYRDGQLLTALDLSDEQRRHDRLRRLHVHYLHDTWGIALGLEVRQAADNRTIVVGPGYAVDGTGRDILLAESLQVSVPQMLSREAVVLTARYQEDAAFRDRPDLAALCLCGGLDPRHERPLFAWRLPDEVRFGPEVPLVQVVVENGVILGGLDGRVRRYTQPLVRPHIGWGVTEPGRSGWRQWHQFGIDFGLEVVVDTSDVGFTRVPYYFATLQGDFGNRAGEELLFQPDVWPTGMHPTFFLGAWNFITDADRERFKYRIFNRGVSDIPGHLFRRATPVSEAESRRWTVAWVGLEPVSGCEPALNLTRLFTLSGFPVRGLASFIGTSGG